MASESRPSRVRGALPAVAGISLANKSQLLFGLAAGVILTLALAVPWIRGTLLVRAFEDEEARRIAAAWLEDRVAVGEAEVASGPFPPRVAIGTAATEVTLVPLAGAPRTAGEQETAPGDPAAPPEPPPAASPPDPVPEPSGLGPTDRAARFVTEAAAALRAAPDRELVVRRYRVGDRTVVRVAVPVTRRTLAAIPERPLLLDALVAPPAAVPDAPAGPPGAGPGAGSAGPASPATADLDRVVAMLVIDRDAGFADGWLLGTQIWILVAGILGIAASIAAFWLILTRLILSPVRRLRETAEAVKAGDLSIRSEIRTGDEFEQLADTFNTMLDRLEQGRAELDQLNRSLGLKVDELAEANLGLDESNRLKSEFVASVSHELRTPLNSIIGFAELLQELARREDDADPKRLRYLDNIVGSGRTLLEMINELLDMAKIEAGRMEVAIEPTSVADVVEGLVKIMGPQAQAKRIEIDVDVPAALPVVETDAGKLQQILYNFLSNAIKFTPEDGRIALGAERVMRPDRTPMVRLSVTDSGPGVPEDLQDVIFEKFRQVDATHTREHAGTGLGLAICRSLAELLGATVACGSRPGQGATFSVEVPTQWVPEAPPPLMT